MIAIDHDSATRARLAATCARCGVGGWHPDARSCQLQDCGLTAANMMPPGTSRATETHAELAPQGSACGAGAEPSPLGSAPAVPGDVDILVHAPENAS